jgi:hypothetical protein
MLTGQTNCIGVQTMITPISPLFAADVLIFSYTRSQAIADGMLVDVTKPAQEAGCYSEAPRPFWIYDLRRHEQPVGAQGSLQAGKIFSSIPKKCAEWLLSLLD